MTPAAWVLSTHHPWCYANGGDSERRRLQMDVIADAIEAALDGKPFMAVYDLLAHHVRFDNASSFRWINYEYPQYVYSNIKSGERTPLYSSFVSSTYKLSPYLHNVISRRVADGFYTVSEVAPDDFFSTAYYDAYYANKNVSDEGLFFIKCQNGGLVFMIERSLPHAKFDAAELAVIRKMLPIVRALLRRETLFELEDRGKADPMTAIASRLGLSKREHQVAELLLRGHSSKSAARLLGISPHTERVHRKRLYKRLGVSSHVDLFRLFADRTPIENPELLS